MQAAIATAAPSELWRIARWFICALHDLFGGPDHIAQHHTLSRKAYTLLLSWLRVGEAMMRRLIAIEAAAFPARAAGKPRGPRPRTRRLVEFYPDKPDDWRVSFRCFAGDTHASQSSRQHARVSPQRFHDAWPLAERYEALIRAFNDPLAYARRLAARLHAAPQKLKSLLAAPPEYAHRVDQAEAFTQAVKSAWPHTDSS